MHNLQFEPEHDKTNKMICVPSKDSDQLGIRPVWSVFTIHMKKDQVLLASRKAHSKDWSRWAAAQADRSLCWTHR